MLFSVRFYNILSYSLLTSLEAFKPTTWVFQIKKMQSGFELLVQYLELLQFDMM